jgi:16S rRNA (guanine527-N7)-methyltransferase
VSRKPPLTAEGFAEIVSVSRETLARLEAYAELLTRWSARINLIGRDTIADLWRRHILDSAQLRRLVPERARSMIDLGSGAGLPGLVLAVLGVPGVELVEADSRKSAFLREAARVTEAAVTLRRCRIEAVPPHPVDVVTARACAPLDRLLGLAEPFLAPGSECLFLKGERVEEELTLARKDWTMTASQHQSRSDPRGVVLR